MYLYLELLGTSLCKAPDFQLVEDLLIREPEDPLDP